MKKKSFVIIFLIPLFLIITACNPTYTPLLRIIPMTQLSFENIKWNVRKIANYRIEVLVRGSTWHAQYYLLTVNNNVVVDSTSRCIVAPAENGKCQVNPYNADDYKVSGIFEKATSEIESDDINWLTIGYDPTYGFPKYISFFDPSVMDSDWLWAVTSFEELKKS
jgi:hypothetical protein